MKFKVNDLISVGLDHEFSKYPKADADSELRFKSKIIALVGSQVIFTVPDGYRGVKCSEAEISRFGLSSDWAGKSIWWYNADHVKLQCQVCKGAK